VWRNSNTGSALRFGGDTLGEVSSMSGTGTLSVVTPESKSVVEPQYHGTSTSLSLTGRADDTGQDSAAWSVTV
jgi:hypothetical protein